MCTYTCVRVWDKITQYKFIIFSETVDYWTNTINSLKSNNIDFIIKKDEWNLDYILIK